MGLFDTFYFKSYKLKKSMFPNGLGELDLDELQNADYQTKDLGETFTGYFYLKKKDGVYRLYKHDIEYKWVEGNKKGKHFLDRLGHMEEVSTKEILVNDVGTNTIRVYSHFEKENYDYWVEFNLVFLENELLKVEIAKIEKESSEYRKKSNQEFKRKLKEIDDFNNSLKGKMINFIRNAYKSVGILRAQVWIGDKITKIGYAIRNFRF